jgi:chemotaxis methyl-accepting protein methylase
MTLADDPAFPRLVERLEGRGLPSLVLYKDRCLRRRLAVRMRACRARTLAEYVAILEAQAEEVHHLLDALTINVTRFFRNASSWDALADALRALSPGRSLAGWSAGCASGEEAYTLAMVLAGEVGASRMRVDGSDVDRASLARARAGWYPTVAFEEAPAAVLARWTVEDGAGRRVHEALRRRVQWHCHDVGSVPPPRPPYDVVVCRNLLIYFAATAQQQLLVAMAQALRPGGLLLLGKVELLAGAVRALFEPVDLRERLFRRVEA